MNRMGSSPHIESNVPYYYEPGAIDPNMQGQTSLSNIPYIAENENYRNISELWLKHNLEKKASFKKSDGGSLQHIEEKRDENALGPMTNSQRSIKEKENEDFLESKCL